MALSVVKLNTDHMVVFKSIKLIRAAVNNYSSFISF